MSSSAYRPWTSLRGLSFALVLWKSRVPLDLQSPVSRRSESQQDDVSQVVHDAPHASPAREHIVVNEVQRSACKLREKL